MSTFSLASAAGDGKIGIVETTNRRGMAMAYIVSLHFSKDGPTYLSGECNIGFGLSHEFDDRIEEARKFRTSTAANRMARELLRYRPAIERCD